MENFKKLNADKIEQFEKINAPIIEKKIKGNLKIFQFLGDLVELFIPKHAQVYGKMLHDDTKYKSILPDSEKKTNNANNPI